MTDNCNAANFLGQEITEKVEDIAWKKVREEGGDESAVLVMQQNCHHHMCNAWFDDFVKHMSSI